MTGAKKRVVLFEVCLGLALALLLSRGLPSVRAVTTNPPANTASAAILIEQTSGAVLYSQNIDDELYPASTTKIMTAMLTLENMSLDDEITLPDDFVNAGETRIGLEAGATQNVEDLLMAMMLHSANDAAQALAIGVAGSESAFVEMMNQRVEDMGLKHTHFANPNGLHSADHYTSAYDLAMIARAAMDSEEFRRIVSTEEYTVQKVNGLEDFTVYNRNALLSQYAYADGIKTGYTRQAGNCIVASATRNGMQLIAVLLNCTDITAESEALLEWGFDTYSPTPLLEANTVKGSVKILNGGRDAVDVVAEKSLYYVSASGERPSGFSESIDLPVSINAPVHRGEVIGSVSYVDSNGRVYSTNLLAAKDVGKYSLRLVVRQVFQSVWQAFVVPFT
jgi:D-alanyl-D-alanine carboxypeptidase (penicillin-binding protein 5/6)